jgi:hypothetical protein
VKGKVFLAFVGDDVMDAMNKVFDAKEVGVMDVNETSHGVMGAVKE